MRPYIVGVITRSIAVAADAAVLFFTLLTTYSTYKGGGEIRASTKLTTALVQNGIYLMHTT